ncbi:MAG TPA: MdtA/MuxA family multidrug efflux RND transporter periplasmic adaptor subunit [Terriglobales bacterium]|nr:MdtA/MuxA family multidrug efflux RND transporter periplasmic adaptor subunit [Terriglobales bacterium]
MESPRLPPLDLGQSVSAGTGTSPRRRRSGWIWLLILVIAGFVGWHFRPLDTTATGATASAGAAGGRGGRGGRSGGAPTVVVTALATQGSIPVYLRGIGTVAPANTVAIHSRVNGQITAIHFQEGQMVHHGDLLLEVDPRPYQAALDQAQGQLQHDTAVLDDDQLDYQRYLALYQQNILPKQQLDSQAALVNEYKGAIASDQAAIETAKLNLSYCRIAAPIDGRIGLRLVDTGNIIQANDTNGLAVITQVQPIAVLFSLPQAQLPQVLQQLQAGQHPVVAAYDSTNTKLLATGRLLTIDNTIDASTGTFRAKAMFDNRDNALFPNQFVNARMQVGTDQNLTIVPPAAVQQGPNGSYVFAVSPQNQVSMRPVTVQLTEGNQAGISAGLAPGEPVVVDGADKLQEGSRVSIQPAHPASDSAGAASLPGSHGSPGSPGNHGSRRGGRSASNPAAAPAHGG